VGSVVQASKVSEAEALNQLCQLYGIEAPVAQAAFEDDEIPIDKNPLKQSADNPNDVRLYSFSTRQQVQDWFFSYREGKFSTYAKLFQDDDGEDILSYTEVQLEIILQDIRGSMRLYNVLQQQLKQQLKEVIKE